MDTLQLLWDEAVQTPALFAVGVMLAFAAGLVAGLMAKAITTLSDDADAGDTHSHLFTNNSSLVDLQRRQAMQQIGVRPHARAGRSPLKPSYDGRKHAAAVHQTPDSPRA